MQLNRTWQKSTSPERSPACIPDRNRSGSNRSGAETARGQAWFLVFSARRITAVPPVRSRGHTGRARPSDGHGGPGQGRDLPGGGRRGYITIQAGAFGASGTSSSAVRFGRSTPSAIAHELGRPARIMPRRAVEVGRGRSGAVPSRSRRTELGGVHGAYRRFLSIRYGVASTDFVTDRPSSRSLSRSVLRVIPRSRAAWSWLPSVDSSTSGRRSRSSCWCASW